MACVPTARGGSLAASLGIALASVCAVADGPIEARQRVEVSAEPEALWQRIGDFCAIAEWHPAVVGCERSEENGGTYRMLTLADGASIRERLIEEGPTSYTYAIIESPLPVADYAATFEVTADDDGGSGIRWRGTFAADGASDDDARATIEGIYAAGLESIEEMF